MTAKRKALDLAIECLRISDVYPKQLHVEVGDHYEPKFSTQRLEWQWRYTTSEIRSLVSDNGYDYARYSVDTGIRFVPSDRSEDEDPETIAEITAIFVAEYLVKDADKLTEEAIAEFGKQNVLYHVWPYWRELIQHETARARLPSIVLPMFRLPIERQRKPKVSKPKAKRLSSISKTQKKRRARKKKKAQ